jgi:hypothetical protein
MVPTGHVHVPITHVALLAHGVPAPAVQHGDPGRPQIGTVQWPAVQIPPMPHKIPQPPQL